MPVSIDSTQNVLLLFEMTEYSMSMWARFFKGFLIELLTQNPYSSSRLQDQSDRLLSHLISFLWAHRLDGRLKFTMKLFDYVEKSFKTMGIYPSQSTVSSRRSSINLRNISFLISFLLLKRVFFEQSVLFFE